MGIPRRGSKSGQRTLFSDPSNKFYKFWRRAKLRQGSERLLELSVAESGMNMTVTRPAHGNGVLRFSAAFFGQEMMKRDQARRHAAATECANNVRRLRTHWATDIIELATSTDRQVSKSVLSHRLNDRADIADLCDPNAKILTDFDRIAHRDRLVVDQHFQRFV